MALTILVVDDSPVMREILGVILGADGHEVWFADGVDRGLELLELTSPDVVLTDYNMPEKTGRDLVLRLRADGFDKPIFVVSSECDPTLRTSMAHAGADGWFSKPVSAAALLEALGLVRCGTFESGQNPHPEQFTARAARLG